MCSLVVKEELKMVDIRDSLEHIRIVPSTMMPVKHYGYSAQWFTMWLAICLMYIWIGFKKNEE